MKVFLTRVWLKTIAKLATSVCLKTCTELLWYILKEVGPEHYLDSSFLKTSEYIQFTKISKCSYFAVTNNALSSELRVRNISLITGKLHFYSSYDCEKRLYLDLSDM